MERPSIEAEQTKGYCSAATIGGRKGNFNRGIRVALPDRARKDQLQRSE